MEEAKINISKPTDPRENAEKGESINSPKTAINLERKIIRMFGLYPTKEAKTNPYFYKIKTLITFTISVSFLISMWANIFINFSDTSIVIGTLYFCLTQTTFICKLVNLYTHFDKFEQLELFLHSPTFNRYTEQQSKYIDDARKNCLFFGSLCRVGVTLTVLFYFVFPFLDNSLLPLPSYFPVDIKKYRIVLFAYQMIGLSLDGYVQSSLDVIFCVMISSASAQFEILKDNLRNLGNFIKDSEKGADLIADKLKEHVFHHNTIIEFSVKIENMFQFVQFVQFMVSSVIICVTGYQIILTPITDSKFLTLFFYASCNFIQVFMCCWFGQDIQTSSEGIGESCYMSDWYNYSKDINKTLLIIMERSKRPVTLTAGRFFNLTIDMFVQVVRTSYSYLALLQRMYEVGDL